MQKLRITRDEFLDRHSTLYQKESHSLFLYGTEILFVFADGLLARSTRGGEVYDVIWDKNDIIMRATREAEVKFRDTWKGMALAMGATESALEHVDDHNYYLASIVIDGVYWVYEIRSSDIDAEFMLGSISDLAFRLATQIVDSHYALLEEEKDA